jgi:NAD(P)-dependent dehydrogenase (short-subunit alcohol dehydrogenase family)
VIAESARELARLVRRTRYDFRGKVIVVTGGAGGIGRAFCRVAAARGASLIVVDVAGQRAKDLAGRLVESAGGPGHLAIGADLTDVAQIEAMLARVDKHAGRIDVLVNNTGMTSSARFADRDLASIEQEFART